MNKKYELAKKQGLNWQALMIEETQTEIKVELQKLVLAGASAYQVNKRVVEIIEKLTKDLESEELKRRCEEALYPFATRVYNFLRQTYRGLSLFGLYALISASNGKSTPAQNNYITQFMEQVPIQAYQKAVPLNLYAKTYMQMVERRYDQLVKMEAKEDYSSRVNLRNIAEIQLRQERHEEELERLRKQGVELVWIEAHANCSERCEKWQGKLYSLDATYGNEDGIPYQPLENATEIYEMTKSGKIYKNGCISGFNCRHKLIKYNKGNRPIQIPAKVVDKEREINNKQRYLERGVREWKEKALLNRNNPVAYAYAKMKAKQWNERYIKYSKDNDVAYYPSRTEII